MDRSERGARADSRRNRAVLNRAKLGDPEPDLTEVWGLRRFPWSHLACVGLGLLGACTGDAPPDQPTPLSEEDRRTLQRFADEDCEIVSSANWEALASGYADDAVRMPPNAPAIHGRAAIRSSLDQVPPITACRFEAEQLDGDGQLAYMRASYDMTVSPPGAEPIRDVGKILIVFRKQADGTWVRVVDAWNSDGPLP